MKVHRRSASSHYFHASLTTSTEASTTRATIEVYSTIFFSAQHFFGMMGAEIVGTSLLFRERTGFVH